MAGVSIQRDRRSLLFYTGEYLKIDSCPSCYWRQCSEALIDGNTIQGVGRFGIQVNRQSSAVIVNNTVRNNTGNGITIGGSSYVLIGIRSGLDKSASPNTIENNGGAGITVGRSSSARIVGNTIRNNKGHGVLITRASQADVSNSTIEGNAGNGIDLSQNSAVSLGVGKAPVSLTLRTALHRITVASGSGAAKIHLLMVAWEA